MTTFNPLERASIALSQIGVEAYRHGMPEVQRGLDHLSAHLDLRAGDADEQIAEGMPAPIVMASALHEAVTGSILNPMRAPQVDSGIGRVISAIVWLLAAFGLVDLLVRLFG